MFLNFYHTRIIVLSSFSPITILAMPGQNRGHIKGIPCLHTKGDTFSSVSLNLDQNVSLDDILVQSYFTSKEILVYTLEVTF